MPTVQSRDSNAPRATLSRLERDPGWVAESLRIARVRSAELRSSTTSGRILKLPMAQELFYSDRRHWQSKQIMQSFIAKHADELPDAAYILDSGSGIFFSSHYIITSSDPTDPLRYDLTMPGAIPLKGMTIHNFVGFLTQPAFVLYEESKCAAWRLQERLNREREKRRRQGYYGGGEIPEWWEGVIIAGSGIPTEAVKAFAFWCSIAAGPAPFLVLGDADGPGLDGVKKIILGNDTVPSIIHADYQGHVWEALDATANRWEASNPGRVFPLCRRFSEISSTLRNRIRNWAKADDGGKRNPHGILTPLAETARLLVKSKRVYSISALRGQLAETVKEQVEAFWSGDYEDRLQHARATYMADVAALREKEASKGLRWKVVAWPELMGWRDGMQKLVREAELKRLGVRPPPATTSVGVQTDNDDDDDGQSPKLPDISFPDDVGSNEPIKIEADGDDGDGGGVLGWLLNMFGRIKAALGWGWGSI